jgi:hypothetical protein
MWSCYFCEALCTLQEESYWANKFVIFVFLLSFVFFFLFDCVNLSSRHCAFFHVGSEIPAMYSPFCTSVCMNTLICSVYLAQEGCFHFWIDVSEPNMEGDLDNILFQWLTVSGLELWNLWFWFRSGDNTCICFSLCWYRTRIAIIWAHIQLVHVLISVIWLVPPTASTAPRNQLWHKDAERREEQGDRTN